MTKKLVEDHKNYFPSCVISKDALSDMEGELLTLVESAGLGEKQEEALKSRVRKIIWNQTFQKRAHDLDADEVIVAFQAVDDYRENPPEKRDVLKAKPDES